MSDNYFAYYKDKISRRGINLYERNINHLTREFNLYFKDALTVSECLINGVKAILAFQDHSQSNNKDLSDDKYVVAKNDTSIGVGDYIDWQNSEWLVFTEEYKTIPTHQQLKIKRVNQTIKWMVNGEVVNNGDGYGAYVQSQTLYTMGVAESPLIPVVDSKMSMYMQNNPDTLKLNMDDRVFVGRRVYSIKFIDDVSRPGLISYLLDESRIGEYDNRELGIADYYGKDSKKDDKDTPRLDIAISGEKNPRISKSYTYTVSDGVVSRWFLDDIYSELYETVAQDDKSITIKIKDNYRIIGKKINIVAEMSNGQFASHLLSIAKKF